MLSSLLESSSGRVGFSKLQLRSGQAFKVEPGRVGSGETIKYKLGSGFASLVYCSLSRSATKKIGQK